MTLARVGLAAFIALTLPFLALAQEGALRAAIRADIMSDPRSSEMSPTEINALVDALAMQAEEQGVAQDYLDSQNSFEPAESPVYEADESTFGLSPLSIAIATLIIVFTAVAIYLIWQRNARRSSPPSAGMVA